MFLGRMFTKDEKMNGEILVTAHVSSNVVGRNELHCEE